MALIFCSVISVGLIISASFSQSHYYIAIEDVSIFGDDIVRGNPPSMFFNIRIGSNPDEHYLRFGVRGLSTAYPDYHGFLMRFSLRNKPTSWTKCEISLYVYDDYGATTTCAMYLFEGNWSATSSGVNMNELEIYWEIEDPIASLSNNQIGFDRTDISEYINDIPTGTFSIVIYRKSTQYSDGTGKIYSSEWDGIEPMFPYTLLTSDTYKNYLPQLIWS
jgi:hypothetical protein